MYKTRPEHPRPPIKGIDGPSPVLTNCLMPSKFARDLLTFRQHVVALRRLGYAHVSAKYGDMEFHCESAGPLATEHCGAMLPGEGKEVDEEWDTLGRGK